MDSVDPLRFVFGFIFVLGLIGVMAVVLKKYARKHSLGSVGGEGRLRVIEVRYIDHKRKLVLVRCDNREHLLLLSDGRELVIESGSVGSMMTQAENPQHLVKKSEHA
jgi:flagellar protein FliO/FliZ